MAAFTNGEHGADRPNGTAPKKHILLNAFDMSSTTLLSNDKVCKID